MQESESEASLLDPLIEQAALGSRKAAQKFFESFLQAQIIVLERFQATSLSNSPRYPDDFFNILAIQDGSRVVVPAFSDPGYIEEWSGQTFTYRRLAGEKLLNLLPESWVLDLNPGQEFGKEFSAWEISELKLGQQAIPALLEENFSETDITPAHIQSVGDDEYSALKNKLTEFAEQHEQILQLSLLKEYQSEAISSDAENHTRLLLGVWIAAQDDSEHDQLTSDLEALAKKALIGAEPIRVHSGRADRQDIALSIFQKTEPFFLRNKQQSMINRLVAGFRSIFKENS